MGLAGFIFFFESYHRLRAPRAVDELTMFVVAGLGLIVNTAIMWSMRLDQRHDLNIRTAYLHMLGDAVGSVGIIAGAIAIRYTGGSSSIPCFRSSSAPSSSGRLAT